MAVDPTNSAHVFAVTGADRGGSTGNHVFQTTNGGVSWTSITGNLNTELWAQGLAVDWRFATPALYVATARGVYFSANTGSTWSVLGAGKHQMPVCTLAAQLGGNVRVGLEDSLAIGRGRLAASNAEQVAKIVRIIREMGLEPATPAEARAALGLKGADRTTI